MFCLPAIVFAEEITIYNKDGYPIAYLNTLDDNTIYMWDGQPSGYLKDETRHYSIYGFNGKHLGWYDKGFILDFEGKKAGFTLEAADRPIRSNPQKGIKQKLPRRSEREIAPYKPSIRDEWSGERLDIILLGGL